MERVCVKAQCTTLSNITISSNVPYSGETYIGGNITIEQGGVLTIAGYTYIGANKSITIKKGGKLILNKATLNVCNGSGYWTGIIVEKDGMLDTQDSNLYNAKEALLCNDGSKISIKVLNIHGIVGVSTGINIKRYPLISYLIDPHNKFRISISNCKIGIFNNSNISNHIFDYLNFDNCNVGIQNDGQNIGV
ncbi:MAG: hypothetical protein IPO92_20245 [Saprospiraceae bacterium]|nr:hypothetical protein [Saprospiraceae bacterium]